MPDQEANTQRPQGRNALQTAEKAAIGLAFFLILLIPRMRRLRRRVGIWTSIRVATALGGGGLLWRFRQHDGGALVLCGGLLLFAFALFMRARPMVKTAEEKARELGALVVLNGGPFIPSEGAAYPDAQIFVFPERLLVLDRREEPVGEIPLARVGRYTARPSSSGAAREGTSWELEIAWESGSACFRYEGFFAEHLARVAETTLRNLLRKELPVLKT
jgi:hypothetical protein